MAKKKSASKKSQAEVKMVRFKLNGKPLEVPAGTTIIEAALAEGLDVPYFCYHPGLSPEGNCRMCLVEVSNSRKPVASCITPVAEGTEVLTDSPGAKEAREGVLELMLVNHPLDCPICDKSGECLLQNHTYDHGPDNSRMVEPKVIKPTKDLGSKILLWGNRCIVCTRCVRFCNEVAGTGELTIVERGDHSVVDVFPDYPIENPLSLNTVDICPVGALISKEFLYQARVWYMKNTNSICTGCARGCNIEIQTLSNQIKRLAPRHNPHVNDYWMCDYGREEYRPVAAEDRLLRYRLVSPATGSVSTNAADAASTILQGLQKAIEGGGPQAVAGVASAFMTLEELFIFKAIFEQLGSSRLGALARPVLEEERFKKFVISGDKNPNRAGVERILEPGALGEGLEAVKDGIRKGEIRAAILVCDLPDHPLDSELVELVAKLEFAAVFLLHQDENFPEAVSLLPATTFAEKGGVMVNESGRLQRLRTAVQPPRLVKFELEIFQEILVSLGERDRILSPDGVFRQLGQKLLRDLEGKTHRDVGDQGLPLSNFEPEASGASTER